MASLVSDIVIYRARSVISRYLHQRVEPKSIESPKSEDRVQVFPSAATGASDSKKEADNSQPPRPRPKPLADDYDIHSLNVFDLLDYLNEQAFEREISLVTARCYRRWLAAYLESANHPEAARVRLWIIPHSREYYEMLLSATDQIESEKQTLAAEKKSKEADQQLDMFVAESSASAGLEKEDWIGQYTEDQVTDMMLETQQIKESQPIAEYDYVSSDVTDIFIAALTSKKATGGFRYKHGELSATLFMATIMLGLRPQEWQHANYHESYTDPISLITLGPIVEVHTLKQSKRRDDNPLRDKRLIVIDKFREPEKLLIKAAIQAVRLHDHNMNKMLQDVRKTLTNVWKRLIKEGKVTPTNKIQKSGRKTTVAGSKVNSEGYGVNLYTARHVFAEEVKRSGEYTRFELAAMIGHTTTVNQRYYTLSKNYKLKTYAHTLPRPWPNDALDIEKWCNEVMDQLSPSEVARLREDGVFCPSTGNRKEFDKANSLENFFAR